MISCTGNNLNLLIIANDSPESEWMSFASWYSSKLLFPEAEIFISIPNHSSNYFRWIPKAKIKRYRNLDKKTAATSFPKPLIIIPSNVVAIRELTLSESGVSNDEAVWFLGDTPFYETNQVNALCCPCTSDEITTFTQINDRCGLCQNWSQKSPFGKNTRLPRFSPNENAVLNLWEKMQKFYILMG